MSKAFLKHANCLYVTRNSKKGEGTGPGAAHGAGARSRNGGLRDAVAAHPKRQRNTRKMTMSSQPLSHESGNYMQQMKHALRHAACSRQQAEDSRQRTQKLKCQGKTKLNSKVNSSSKAKAKVKVNLKVKYLECAPAQAAATAAHRRGSHRVRAVPAAAAAQCPEAVEYYSRILWYYNISTRHKRTIHKNV